MLRTLHKVDLPEILIIESSVHVAPWTAETFKTCFQAGYPGWVIELEKKVIGFIMISLTQGECHILNVCVSKEHQHKGWGQQMLERALLHAKQRGAGIAYLEVRRSNTKAIALYQKMNFHRIGERKNYYATVAGQEDALIFAMSLSPAVP